MRMASWRASKRMMHLQEETLIASSCRGNREAPTQFCPPLLGASLHGGMV